MKRPGFKPWVFIPLMILVGFCFYRISMSSYFWMLNRGFYEAQYMQEHKCYPKPHINYDGYLLDCQHGEMRYGDIQKLSRQNVKWIW